VLGTGALHKATWDGPPSPPLHQEPEVASPVLTLEDRLQRAITRAVRPQPWAPWGRRKADILRLPRDRVDSGGGQSVTLLGNSGLTPGDARLNH
jgi:hypothetical protein